MRGSGKSFGNSRSVLLAGLLAVLGGGAVEATAQQYLYDVTTVAGVPGKPGSKDGTTTNALLRSPQGVAIGKSGSIYIADTGNHIIRVRTTSGNINTLAGLVGVPDAQDGIGSGSRFNSPMGLVTDSSENVYVADSGNHTIRKVTANGNVTTFAGSAGWMGAIDGDGEVARFYSPKGLAIDASGNIYIADSGNHLIRKMSKTGSVTTLAGSPAISGASDGTGNQAQFSSPTAVAVDTAGNVYVADLGNRSIRKITSAGVVSTLITADQGDFNQPLALGVDRAANLYVADSVNQTIEMFSQQGVITILGGKKGVAGSVDGFGTVSRFNGIGAIAVDLDGNALVADTANHTVRKAALWTSPVILNQSQSQTNPAGSTVTLSVQMLGTEPLHYQWYFNNVALTNGTASQLILTNVQSTNIGDYFVTVSNWLAVTSSVMTLSVTPAPVVISIPTKFDLWQGDAFSQYIYSAGSDPVVYDAVGLPLGLVLDKTNGLISGVVMTNGTFVATVTGKNAYGSDSKAVTFTISSSTPVITSPSSVTGVQGRAVNYRITATFAPTNFWATGLPLGLSVDPRTGAIIGTPVYAGVFTNAMVYAQNAWATGSAHLSLTIASTPIEGLALDKVKPLYSSPYLLDFQFALRDGTNSDSHAVVVPPSQISVRCFEDTNPISATETAVIIERADKKPRKTYLLLDYSASMEFGSADSNGDGVSDAIESMQNAAKALINQQPDSAQFGIYEFHSDDTAPQRVISLTSDKLALSQAIDSILPKYVQWNFAGTRCWDAVFGALTNLPNSNPDEQRQVVIMTDGYDESSMCSSNGVVDAMVARATNQNVTLNCVAFGTDVNLPVLQQLTDKTGGRYYVAATPADLAIQFGLLGKDMDGQYLLRWASLKRSAAPFQPSFELTIGGLTTSFNTGLVASNYVTTNYPPVDTNNPPPVNNTNFTLTTNFPVVPDFVPTNWAGNVKVGALRLLADAEDGPRTVTLRAAYVPRYVRTLRVHYRANYPCATQLRSSGASEILEGWSLSETNDGAGGKWLQISSTNQTNLLTSIPYGALGSLVTFTFRELPSSQQAFSLFTIDNSVYTNLPAGQSFTVATNGFMTNYPATTHGTPVPWLRANGFTNDVNVAEMSDPDLDGIPTWMEYVEGTNPRDASSAFRIRSIGRVTSYSPYQVIFNTATNHFYRVEVSPDLTNWNVLQDNIPGTGVDATVYDNRSRPTTNQFYRVFIYP